MELLGAIPGVVEAAAVYSGVDVVAMLAGTPTEIDNVYSELNRRGAPIEGTSRFPVEGIPGASFGNRSSMLRGGCMAYVEVSHPKSDPKR